MLRYTVDEGGYEDYIEVVTDENAGGGCLQGGFNAPYKVICEAFGPPTYNDPSSTDKTTCEWRLRIGAYHATIYDYKGERWHVGGTDKYSYESVMEVLTLYRKGNRPEIVD